MMTQTNEAQIEAKVSELISSKIAAEDEDSGWVVAYAMMRSLPVLQEMAVYLKAINEAIAPDVKGDSVAGELRSILNVLRRELKDRKE
jgi:hypothetical protein